MNKIKKIVTSPITTIAAFALAVVLLGYSTVGGARAALTYYSETYASQVEMHDIGVTLVENGRDISVRDYLYEEANGSWAENTGALLGAMLNESAGKLALNKAYTEQIAAKNSGTIDTYVRVTLYRYWLDKDGNKTQALDPALIELEYTNLAQDGGCWIIEDAATTAERTVAYYNKLLPAGATTPDLTSTIKINGNIAEHVTMTQDADGTTYWDYDYNGYKFVLVATVDSVQDHNAKDAILSAWGKNVTIENQTLSLNY